jgi:hypothetical protein
MIRLEVGASTLAGSAETATAPSYDQDKTGKESSALDISALSPA